MKKILSCLFCLLFLGCATASRPHFIAFSDADFIPYAGKGDGKIIGQAFLKTKGGDVKYGAGNEVVLVPVTPYTEEINRAVIEAVRMEPPDGRYLKYRRTTRADGQGNFEFTDLPAGEYFLGCSIYWQVGGRYTQTTGGVANARTSVKSGETVKVILTR
jgi:hypothetical protein